MPSPFLDTQSHGELPPLHATFPHHGNGCSTSWPAADLPSHFTNSLQLGPNPDMK